MDIVWIDHFVLSFLVGAGSLYYSYFFRGVMAGWIYRTLLMCCSSKLGNMATANSDQPPILNLNKSLSVFLRASSMIALLQTVIVVKLVPFPLARSLTFPINASSL